MSEKDEKVKRLTGKVSRQANAVAAKAGFAAIGLVVGLLLGIAAVLFIQSYNPKDEKSAPEVLAASVVFDRVLAQDKLVSASQTYNIVEKVGSVNRLPFVNIEIPITYNHFWYRYVGTVEMAVNLETAVFSQEGEALKISLEQPFISSNTPDAEKSGVLEEANNILNPIHVEDVDSFTEQCLSTGEREALEGGLAEEARANAEDDIRRMFNAALGDGYSVEFEWR